ncbi:MAG: hypothetical protein QW303_08655 [Nitrososphaerota archaeon]
MKIPGLGTLLWPRLGDKGLSEKLLLGLIPSASSLFTVLSRKNYSVEYHFGYPPTHRFPYSDKWQLSSRLRHGNRVQLPTLPPLPVGSYFKIKSTTELLNFRCIAVAFYPQIPAIFDPDVNPIPSVQIELPDFRFVIDNTLNPRCFIETGGSIIPLPAQHSTWNIVIQNFFAQYRQTFLYSFGRRPRFLTFLHETVNDPPSTVEDEYELICSYISVPGYSVSNDPKHDDTLLSYIFFFRTTLVEDEISHFLQDYDFYQNTDYFENTDFSDSVLLLPKPLYLSTFIQGRSNAEAQNIVLNALQLFWAETGGADSNVFCTVTTAFGTDIGGSVEAISTFLVYTSAVGTIDIIKATPASISTFRFVSAYVSNMCSFFPTLSVPCVVDLMFDQKGFQVSHFKLIQTIDVFVEGEANFLYHVIATFLMRDSLPEERAINPYIVIVFPWFKP